ncbi:MAG: hypothetical protein U0457_06315 [Candidatus Sericytochromatia bacterium]
MIEVLEKEIVTSRAKSTSELSFEFNTKQNSIEKIEKRLKAFLKNPEWVYEAISLFDKVIKGESNFTKFELWAVERLDLELSFEYNTPVLKDRYQRILSKKMLSDLKSRVINLTTIHANKLLRTPKLHHMEKSFLRVLRKSLSQQLTEEEISILSDAYLKVENNVIVNLKGEKVRLPKFGILSVFSLFF